MRYCQTEGFCAVFGHRTVDQLPCCRRPILPEWVRIFGAAVISIAMAWWFIVAMWAAAPAGAQETQWWEGWEPKNALPTQAIETLDRQAVTLIPPLEIEVEPEPVTGVEQWRHLVAVYGGWDVDRMLRIMWCESRGVPTAQNPRSTATGLFQIMASIWWPNGPRSDLHDPVLNVDVAWHVWNQQGYGAWVCRG